MNYLEMNEITAENQILCSILSRVKERYGKRTDALADRIDYEIEYFKERGQLKYLLFIRGAKMLACKSIFATTTNLVCPAACGGNVSEAHGVQGDRGTALGYNTKFIADLFEYARKNDIEVFARDAMNSSVLLYLYEVTEIDPVYFQLPFKFPVVFGKTQTEVDYPNPGFDVENGFAQKIKDHISEKIPQGNNFKIDILSMKSLGFYRKLRQRIKLKYNKDIQFDWRILRRITGKILTRSLNSEIKTRVYGYYSASPHSCRHIHRTYTDCACLGQDTRRRSRGN